MSRILTLRDVPEPVVRALRQRAKRNRRSVQKETLQILRSAVLDRASLADQLLTLRSRTGVSMTLAQIHSAIEEGR